MTWLGYGSNWTQRFSYDSMSDRKAPHIGHRHHLCFMTESGEYSLERIKDLVKDAKFMCRKCGRVAGREENVCEPVPL